MTRFAVLAGRPVLRRALVPIGAFVGVVCAGIAGFVALADIGAIEAAFWLIDPTSIELHFETHEGPAMLVKAFAIVVLSGQVLAGLWVAETVLSSAFGGRIQEELERVRNERRIDELTDHVIVCGYGMFGRTIAERLAANGTDVVVVERDDAEFERIPEDTPGLSGDARREEVLLDAGIERARTVVTAIDDSNTNIQIAILATQLAPDVRIVVRVGDEMYESLARRAGADEVIIPEVVSGSQVSELLRAGGV